MAASYAWIVDSTLTFDPDDTTKLVEDTEGSDNGTWGPHNAHPELVRLLQEGKGRNWRTLYTADYAGHPASERLVHTGRYLDLSDLDPALADNVRSDAEFGPLDDLSQPGHGAGDIEYQDEDGTWRML
jgi:hypothetical protein